MELNKDNRNNPNCIVDLYLHCCNFLVYNRIFIIFWYEREDKIVQLDTYLNNAIFFILSERYYLFTSDDIN